MISGMDPVLKPGRYAYRTVAEMPSDAIGSFVEDEGLSVIVPASSDEIGFRQIMLRVNSALDGVGLTAAVASALTAEDIPANVIAAHHHDHVFVPEAKAERAVSVLKKLAEEEGGKNGSTG